MFRFAPLQLDGQAPTKQEAEYGIELAFNEHAFEKKKRMIPGMKIRAGIVGLVFVKRKPHAEVGYENAQDGNAPECIHQLNAFVVMYRVMICVQGSSVVW